MRRSGGQRAQPSRRAGRDEVEEVLRTSDPVRASWALAVLNDAGIRAVLADLNAHVLEGGGVAIPRRVLAPSEDASRARWIIETQDPLRRPGA